MPKPYLHALLICLPLAATAGPSADSLRQVLARTGQDTARVHVLNTLAQTYTDTRPDSAVSYGTQALELAQQLAFEPGVAEALRIIGIGHMRQQEYGIATSHLQRALALWTSLGDAEKQRRTHFALAHIAEQQSDFPEALKQYLTSLKFAEQLGTARRWWTCA